MSNEVANIMSKVVGMNRRVTLALGRDSRRMPCCSIVSSSLIHLKKVADAKPCALYVFILFQNIMSLIVISRGLATSLI